MAESSKPKVRKAQPKLKQTVVVNSGKSKKQRQNQNASARDKVERFVANPSWKSGTVSLDEDRDYAQTCELAMAQFVDPPRLNEAVMCPDDAPNQRCVRRFVSRFRIADTDPGCADGFTVVAAPSLKAPITFTGGNALLPAGAAGPLAVDGFFESTNANIIGDSSFIANDQVGNKATCRLHDVTEGGTTYPSLLIANTATANGKDVMLVITDGGSNTKLTTRLSVYRTVLGSGVWTLIDTVAVGSDVPPLTMYLGTNAFGALGFSVTSSGAKNHKVHVKYATTGGGLSQATVVGSTDLGRGEVVTQVEEATGGRLVGMSMLISNTSSDLGNGGTITAARVPAAVSPFATTAAINSRSPQHDFYQGPAKTGAYVWWLPRESDTQTFCDIDQAEQSLSKDCYLYGNVSGWGGANPSSVQITVHYVVEFYIATQLFEKLVPPPRLPLWDAYMHALAQVPAASCNPNHLDMFRQGLSKARSFIENATAHYKKHQAIYDAAFKALAKIAA